MTSFLGSIQISQPYTERLWLLNARASCVEASFKPFKHMCGIVCGKHLDRMTPATLASGCWADSFVPVEPVLRSQTLRT
jgi:hypothetical protein